MWMVVVAGQICKAIKSPIIKYIFHVSISTADPSSMNLMDSLEQELMKEADISLLSSSFILRITLRSALLPGISSSAVLKSTKASLVDDVRTRIVQE